MNAIVLAIVIMFVLSLLRFSVVLAVVIAAIVGGLVGGLGLAGTVEAFNKDLGDGAQVALAYPMQCWVRLRWPCPVPVCRIHWSIAWCI